MSEKRTGNGSKPKKPGDVGPSKPLLYDAVRFHWPMAKERGCKSLGAAKIHLHVVMRWLADQGLLRPGVWAGEIPDDFELRSDLLTDRGNALMKKAYNAWLRTVRYGEEPSRAVLDRHLRSLPE